MRFLLFGLVFAEIPKGVVRNTTYDILEKLGFQQWYSQTFYDSYLINKIKVSFNILSKILNHVPADSKQLLDISRLPRKQLDEHQTRPLFAD